MLVAVKHYWGSDEMDKKTIVKRFNALKVEQQLYVPLWKKLSANICPARGWFDERSPTNIKKIDYKVLLDNTSYDCSRVLASGMLSGMSSPSRKWFRITTADPDIMTYHPAKEWLDTGEKIVTEILAKSNIYRFLESIYHELGVFSVGCGLIEEDIRDVVRGYGFTAGEYYLGIGYDGRINSFGRSFWMTVLQMVKQFGIENVSVSVRNMYDCNNVDNYIKVCHLIEPNDDRIEGKLDVKNKAFRSIYWEYGTDDEQFLRVSGYEQFPIVAPRWGVRTTFDIYDMSSPGFMALGDAMMLQDMEGKSLEALEKVIDPPLQVPESVKDSPVNTLPGHISTKPNDNQKIEALYQIAPDIAGMESIKEVVRKRISTAFYKDLFLMLTYADNGQMTATEITARNAEKVIALGPVLESVQSDLLSPLIERTFYIALKAGMIHQPPEEIQGMDLKIEYTSMLAQSQKMVNTTAVEQLFGFVGNLSAVFPSSVDVVDADTAVKEYGDMLGVSPKILRSEDAIQQIRKQRAQQQAVQQQMEAIQNGAQAAQVLSKTDMGGNNALNALLGNGQGG